MDGMNDEELLELCDQFSDFKDRCSFLCDAFVALMSREGVLNVQSMDGMAAYAAWVQVELSRIGEKLEHIRQNRVASGIVH